MEIVALADVFEDRLEDCLRKSKALKPELADRVKVDPEHHFVGFDAYKKAIDSPNLRFLFDPGNAFYPPNLVQITTERQLKFSGYIAKRFGPISGRWSGVIVYCPACTNQADPARSQTSRQKVAVRAMATGLDGSSSARAKPGSAATCSTGSAPGSDASG